MKNIFKQFSLLLILGSVTGFYTACKKTTDKPHINQTTIGGTVTISQLKAMFAANNGQNIKFTQDISLFATVTMTDNYKTLYIKDNTGAMSLKQLTAHGIFAGDSLRINLNNSTLDLSGTACSIQIDSVDVSDSPTCKVVKLAVGKPITPIQVTLAQLNHSISSVSYPSVIGNIVVPSSVYDGQLVQINDVEFDIKDSANYIGTSGAVYYNSTLFDCGQINSIILALYSGTSDFQNKPKPNRHSGYIIGAISFYNNALQITPRSFPDVVFNQPRCGVQTLNVSFDTVACGAGATLPNASCPGWFFQKQYGYYNCWGGTTATGGPIVDYFPSANITSSTDNRNVDWFITPAIQYSPTKNINFQNFTSNNTAGVNLLSVLVSTDFNGYNLGGSSLSLSPVTLGHQAHWTDITSSFNFTTSGSSTYWTSAYAGTGVNNLTPVYFSNTNAGNTPGSILNGYTGTFYVAFRYTANKTNVDSTASYGIGNVIIKN